MNTRYFSWQSFKQCIFRVVQFRVFNCQGTLFFGGSFLFSEVSMYIRGFPQYSFNDLSNLHFLLLSSLLKCIYVLGGAILCLFICVLLNNIFKTLFSCLSSFMKQGPQPTCTCSLTARAQFYRASIARHFLRNKNVQDTSHNWYMWNSILAGNLIPL